MHSKNKDLIYIKKIQNLNREYGSLIESIVKSRIGTDFGANHLFFSWLSRGEKEKVQEFDDAGMQPGYGIR